MFNYDWIIKFVNLCNYEFVPINQWVCVILNLWIFVLIDRISNSQTSKPIGSSKSPMVDLVGEDLKVEEQEGTKEEGEQEGTNENVYTSRKRKTTSDV